MSTEKKLTSVKIDEDLWDDFRISAIRHKFSFQKLAERSIYLYLHNDEFKRLVHNTKNTTKDTTV